MLDRNTLIVIIVSTILAIGGIIPLLGIPGAIVFQLSTPFLPLIFGAEALKRLPSDSAWPIAVYITLLWPPSIVAGYLLSFKLLTISSWLARIGLWSSIVIGWGLLLSIACYILATRPQRG
ncbi:MAG: hypothetical protein N5P05_002383 [Chroococcopsis gigantea SAG 12.99]|jgi:hypothetical protein|nr:hypothetical protein [Chlorogloea purpurea SAG 13.99]MDV3000777.1 hypothetical protein [Chroococcopsis gigantea SAG 12.99]